jgi:hypothetical protein
MINLEALLRSERAQRTNPNGTDHSIKCRTHARIGLLGNPSDGYNGKCIAISLANYYAEVFNFVCASDPVEPALTDRVNCRSPYAPAMSYVSSSIRKAMPMNSPTLPRFVPTLTATATLAASGCSWLVGR